nr:putative reverse transcriptase domain-containing protein [Tanacetum cinerariifolium]
HYDVELADGKIIGVNTIVRGCTLNFMNHPFNIDLMPVPLGSFDVIIVMDWLTKYHGVIIHDEKIIRVPFGREMDGMSFWHTLPRSKPRISRRGNDLRMCRLLETFLKIFLEDLLGVPPARQVEFQIDLKDESFWSSIYSKIDLRSGYHQLRVRKEDIPKTAFRTRYGHYEFQNKEEHEGHLKLILELLKKEELYTKFSKCEFWILKVRFLRHMIDSKGIHVDPAKIVSIKDWASPKSPVEICQFSGVSGYYRRFIEGFSKIAKSMTKLTQKNVMFYLGENEEAAFQLIKQKLCSAPILALPKGSENFIVYSDASHKGLGAVLMQNQKGADEELSNGGSPRVIVYGYNGLLMKPVAPPSPDYIPGPEEPHTPSVPQDEDEREPMFIQPHDPDYDDPFGYPMNGEDDRDDDDGDSSGDDANDEDEDEEDEEHLTLTDSADVIPTVELVSPPDGIELVIPPPSTDITTIRARITVQLQAAISLPPEAEVERLLAMPTPPLSPLTSLSPPSTKERLARCTAPSAHSSPPHVPSPLLTSSGCPTQIQTLRIASNQVLIDAVTAELPSPPLPPLPPPLYIPPPIDRRDDILETEMPPRKRSCLFTLGSRDTWVDPAEAIPKIAPMTLGVVNTRVTELDELHEHDTQDLYALLKDAQDKTLREMGDMRKEMGDMQAELLALQEQLRRARQPRSDARVPDLQDAPRGVDSHI